MMRRLIYIGIMALALSSCQHNIEEILLSRSDISLTVKGELQMSYNENSCQLGYNTTKNQFRVYNEDLENWFILSCSAKPTSEGQQLKADLEYKTGGSTKSLKELDFSVERVSSEGLIWLWNKDKQIGIVVKSL